MAIYRPPKARWPLACVAALAGLLIGLLVGLVAGREEFDSAEAGQEIKTRLSSAAGSLEVAAVEYAESVAEGEVNKQAEFDGALAAVASSRAKFSEIRPALMFPRQIDMIGDAYERAERSMKSHAEPRTVTSLLVRLQGLLEGT
jgi:hypothetical protein